MATALLLLGAMSGRCASDEIDRLVRATDFESAATELEHRARDAGCTVGATESLRRAIALRRGLGEDARADDDLRSLSRCATDDRAFSRAMSALVLDLGLSDRDQQDPKRLEKHLRDFIARFGRFADENLLAEAHLRLGILLWERSCPIHGFEDACIERVRSKERCGARYRIEVRRRDKRLATEAQRHFLEAGRSNGEDLAAARFYQMEPKFETLLSVHRPE